MKIPDKESIKKSGQAALSGIVPDNLVDNAKSLVTDKIKDSIVNATPDFVKNPVEQLMSAKTDADGAKIDKSASEDTSQTREAQANQNSQDDGAEEPKSSSQPPSQPPTPPPSESQPPSPSSEPDAPVSLTLALFGGAGIGLLFGVIMGMSVTPTVATVLGALTAMLAGILGLNDGNFSDAKAVRIGGFGFACVIGALMGLYVRAHNAMAPSMLDMKQEYIAVGFSEAQALAFIAQKTMGATLNPESGATPNVESETEQSADTSAEPVQEQHAQEQQAPDKQVAAVQFNNPEQLAKAHSSLLFSADVDISSCVEMENTDHSIELDEVLNNFELTGGMWEVAFYWAVDNIPESEQKNVMIAAKDAICRQETIEQEVCKNITPLNTSLTHQQINAEFATDPSWQAMKDYIVNLGFTENQQTQSLLLVKNTLCGEL